MIEAGVLEPVWACGPVLPNSLVDLDGEDRRRKTRTSLTSTQVLK